MKQFDPVKNRIFEAITGSQLYGTSTPESDIDYRGVTIPDMEVLLNPFENFKQQDRGFEEDDRTLYALGQWMKLCADSNPNIVELLFVPEQNIVFNSDDWQKILEHKHLFLSRKAKWKFSGYAMSQLRAIQRRRKWFVDPPKEKPTRKSFGLTDDPIVSESNLNALVSVPLEMIASQYLDELGRERRYRKAKEQWDNYVSWRDNRNPKRREMEESFGYDTKHASHLVRLITEAKELLTTGKITFPLQNAEEILAIKNGKYSYDEILEISDTLDSNFQQWHDQSILPKAPNRNALTKLYFDVIMKG